MSEVTIVGSINIDLTSYLTRWPKVGETIKTKQTLISLGGKGANQAVAASRMGAKTTMIGAIGSDAFGADIQQWLLDFDIDLEFTTQKDVATGMAFIDVGPDGDNVIRLSAGANDTLTSQVIEGHAKAISKSKIVVLQNEIPFEASLKAAQIAREAGAFIVMDPAPAPEPFWTPETLSWFDVVTPNSHETKMMTGHEPHTLTDAEDAARKLQDHGAKNSIVTMGSKGVAWFINGQSGHLAAPNLDSIDTVGAGDCFNGAFVAAYLAGKPVDTAIQIAAIAAALATTKKGAATAVPTRDEVGAIMKQA